MPAADGTELSFGQKKFLQAIADRGGVIPLCEVPGIEIENNTSFLSLEKRGYVRFGGPFGNPSVSESAFITPAGLSALKMYPK